MFHVSLEILETRNSLEPEAGSQSQPIGLLHTVSMTCAAAYYLPREFTLLAVDGRITDEDGTIYTDTAQKWCQAGCLVAAFAGDMPAIQATMRSWLANSKAIDSVQVAMSLRPKADPAGEWSAIVFDWNDDALYTCDSDGCVLREHTRVTSVGAGSEVALGYLKACISSAGKKWAAPKAKRNVRDAIRAAASRNATVGARSTVLECRPGGKVRVKG
jgi:hypothetical protein